MKEAADEKVTSKKEYDAKLKEQTKEIQMLEKDRFELVKLKTQSGKVDGRVTDLQKENANLQKENATQGEEITKLKSRVQELLNLISKLQSQVSEFKKTDSKKAKPAQGTEDASGENKPSEPEEQDASDKQEAPRSNSNNEEEKQEKKSETEKAKPQKNSNNAVINYSTEDHTFPIDNPFGDNFDKQLEPEEADLTQVKAFKTSGLKQHPKVREFLQKRMTGNAFNKFCLDCKKKKTSHFVVYLGIFVCMDCATNHSRMKYFVQSDQYIKDVNVEQWDDWQLKSVQLGDNKKLFDVFKEYDINELEFTKKYSQPVVKWYRNRHMATLDGKLQEFDQMYSKPPKTVSERYEMTKEAIAKSVEPRLENAEGTAAKFSLFLD